MKETERKKARKEGGSVDLWVGGKKERGGVIIMGGVCYKGCGSHSFFYSYKNETMLLLLNKYYLHMLNSYFPRLLF